MSCRTDLRDQMWICWWKNRIGRDVLRFAIEVALGRVGGENM